MMIASSEAGLVPQDDPTLAALVPRRSFGRRVVVGVAIVALLVSAWVGADIVKPVLVVEASSWGPVGDQGVVRGTARVRNGSWAGATLESVSDVAGARLVGVWLVPSDELLPVDASPPSSAGLPHRFGFFEIAAYTLVVDWEITDCSRLSPGVAPDLRVRSVVGTSGTTFGDQVTDEGWLGPVYDYESLVGSGICPSR